MSLYVNPSNTFESSIYNLATGLVGTLTFAIEDGQGNVVLAASTTNIIESPANSGVYTATKTSPSLVGHYVIIWFDGTDYAADNLYVTTSVSFPLAPSSGWSPDYITLNIIKSSLRITDSNDDAELSLAISSASRAIDNFTERQFGKLTAPVKWYYDLQRMPIVSIDDIMDLTDLVVKTDPDQDGNYDTTLVFDTDYRLYPRNAAVHNKPWISILLSPYLRYGNPMTSSVTNPYGYSSGVPFTKYGNSLEVTGTFGWSGVPEEIREATLLQATRFFARRNAPFGISGSPDMGSEMRLLSSLDPDVKLLVRPLSREWGGC